MAVGVRGGSRLCVAEHLHDDPRVRPFGQQQRGPRVTPVVEADLAYTRFVQEGLPCLPVGCPLDRPSTGLREDEVVVLLEGAGGDAFLELGCPVGPQGVDELDGQRRGAAASLGSGFLVDQALPGEPCRPRRTVDVPSARSASVHRRPRASG